MIPARSPSHVGAVVVLFRPDHTEAPCAPGRVLQVVDGSDLVSVVYDELTGGRVLAGQLCGRVRVIARPPMDNADAWQQLRDAIERSGVPVCWDQEDEGMASLAAEIELDDDEPPVADDLLRRGRGDQRLRGAASEVIAACREAIAEQVLSHPDLAHRYDVWDRRVAVAVSAMRAALGGAS